MSRLVLVVDAANVVGARADGWWRDRAGAARRLRDELAALAADGLAALPPELPHDTSAAEIVMVVEGAAKPVADDAPAGAVRVVAAPGSGDDAIVGLVAEPAPGTGYVVVTADRELRRRVRLAGAGCVGPRWLLEQLTRG